MEQDGPALPAACETIGIAPLIDAIQADTPDIHRIFWFLPEGAQAIILQQVRLKLPTAASAAGFDLALSSLLVIAPSPPTDSAVARFIATFAKVADFARYVGRLNKAVQIVDIDSSCVANENMDTDDGLPGMPNPTEKWRNSPPPLILYERAQFDTRESEFSRLFYVAFLYTSRLPSKAIPVSRAPPDQRLLS